MPLNSHAHLFLHFLLLHQQRELELAMRFYADIRFKYQHMRFYFPNLHDSYMRFHADMRLHFPNPHGVFESYIERINRIYAIFLVFGYSHKPHTVSNFLMQFSVDMCLSMRISSSVNACFLANGHGHVITLGFYCKSPNREPFS